MEESLRVEGKGGRVKCGKGEGLRWWEKGQRGREGRDSGKG